MNRYKGYLVFAQGQNYVRQAALLAMSLKAAGNNEPISIITQNRVPKKWRPLFDKVKRIPWFENSESRFQTENRWKMYHASPYEETIVFDADVLVMQDLSHVWKQFANHDVYYLSNSYTYRDELVTSSYYRKAFIANNLPNTYGGMHYFKKCEFAHDFYKMVEVISNNWQLFYSTFAPLERPKAPAMDITVAIAAKCLGIENEIINTSVAVPKFVHMKPRIQGWTNPPVQWMQKVGAYLSDDLTLRIGNFDQNTIFHYTTDEFVTADVMNKFERNVL